MSDVFAVGDVKLRVTTWLSAPSPGWTYHKSDHSVRTLSLGCSLTAENGELMCDDTS